MSRSPIQLRADAERIWWAGVQAVSPARLIPQQVRVDGATLRIDEQEIDLRRVGRIVVVGAGKAAGAMTVALEAAIGPKLLVEKRVAGWVNVPADCVIPTARVRLHAARPAGVNEPRPEGVEGARRILELVGGLGPADLCICLLSGGGSALLPVPVPGIALDDKIRLTRVLSEAGATIHQLNMMRRRLSLVKGGGLARACRAGQLVALILSDVPGDPLDVIAAGPTVAGNSPAGDALDVLGDLGVIADPQLAAVVNCLEQQRTERAAASRSTSALCAVTNVVIGNNALAVDAAGCEAERLGYSHAMITASECEGPAEVVGRHLATMAVRMRQGPGPDCLISGGEPTVRLADDRIRGKGGRNQQLALAALVELGDCEGVALLSGGTDGEDGPTDAAGACATSDVVERAAKLHLDARDYLRRNDAYHFFAACGGLFKTGPTHTNVCDLRVVVVGR